MSTLQRSTLFTVHNRKMRLGKISLIKHLTIPHENHLIIISINLYLALITFSFYLHNLCRNIITSLCSHRQLYNLHNIMHIISNHHVLWCLYLFPDRSSIKQKTFDPVWNEEFIHEVEGASTLGITVFHKAPLDDVFNANTTISFEDLLARHEQHQKDFWVDLEPSGRLRVKIDLRSSQGEIFSSPSRKSKAHLIFSCRSKSSIMSEGKQRSTVSESTSWCIATTCSSDQWTQIHGNFSSSANVLFPLS